VSRLLSNTIRTLVSAISLTLIPAAICLAWCGPVGVFDGHTRYMWSRTWHGPNALAEPLNQYYIPRTPANCGCGGYGCGAGCQGGEAGIACNYGGLPYPATAAVGFEPVQFERLGRVPNELDIVGAIGNGGPAPAPAAGRRQ
jgi:hypothetical protein